MITQRRFCNWLDDCGYSYRTVYNEEYDRCLMTGTDQVIIDLNQDCFRARDSILVVGHFGRVDNRLEVKYLGLVDLWTADEIEMVLRMAGQLKN